MNYFSVEELGEMARKLRESSGLSQSQMASIIGTSQSNVSAAESGRSTRYTKIAIKVIQELSGNEISGPFYSVHKGENNDG